LLTGAVVTEPSKLSNINQASILGVKNMSVVSIYEDANFQGNSAELDVGQYDWGQLGIRNDSLSSLRVQGGYTVTLYQDTLKDSKRYFLVIVN
jgi:hypothetical protein